MKYWFSIKSLRCLDDGASSLHLFSYKSFIYSSNYYLFLIRFGCISFFLESQDCSPANSQHHNRFSSASNDTPTHECLGVLAHLFMYLPTVLLTSAAGAHSWDRLFCGWGTVLAKELFCRGPRQNSWEM